MDFENSGLSREEIRKRKRRKERTQAIAIFAGVVLAILLVIGGLIYGMIHFFAGKDKPEDKPEIDAVTTERVTEEAEVEPEDTEEILSEEEAEEIKEELVENPEEESEEEPEEEPEETNPFLAEEPNEALEEMVEKQISEMTLEEKVAGLFFATPTQIMGLQSDVTAIGSDFGDKMKKYPVGGILLGASNMEDKDQFESFINDLRLYVDEDTFLGIEDDGGESSPFVESGLTENIISSHQEIGESLGVSGAYSAGISLGGELRLYGIDVNFSPNVDVSLVEGSVASEKGFGTDMVTTSELGKNMVKGLSDQGIAAAVKYFPSYGDVSQDGDGGQVVSQRTKEDLMAQSEPYLAAIEGGADFVMISHVGLPKIRGDKRPACLSKEVITDIVREEWDYDGIVITDFMNKTCMYTKYTYAEAAVGAIEAGADMILAPKNLDKSYNGILDAVNEGVLTEERIDESLRRIYRVKFASEVEN